MGCDSIGTINRIIITPAQKAWILCLEQSFLEDKFIVSNMRLTDSHKREFRVCPGAYYTITIQQHRMNTERSLTNGFLWSQRGA
ncbi:hypothetical protein PILCRDRAFT_693260 [Piloderma croceum F 1598]|uniref:Uncharacterized protein n=1 Tax=Piloderma croceum (strain F 1598) TaxID=765440 RepID=A0A0C3ALY5_PILCF|nr:hypothetical protein PILCRDRAFT_693260 [Piloderma croceum F 1598]